MPQQRTEQSIADQVIQSAIQMEELGRDFYEALASATTDPQVARLCRELAAQETEHGRTFARIRSELARRGLTVLLPDDQLAKSRQAMKDSILPDPQTILGMARKGSVGEALAMAIQMEQNAIRYYTTVVRGFLRDDALNAVIVEEQRHLRSLSALRDRRRA